MISEVLYYYGFQPPAAFLHLPSYDAGFSWSDRQDQFCVQVLRIVLPPDNVYVFPNCN